MQLQRFTRWSRGIPMLASFLVLITPIEGEAQACYEIWFCSVNWNLGDQLAPGPAPHGVHAAPTFYHTNCRYCEYSTCHYGCGEITPSSEDSDTVADERAVEAFLKKDVDQIRTLALQAHPYVQWNATRQAMQLLSCDGETFLASLTLGPDRGLNVGQEEASDGDGLP